MLIIEISDSSIPFHSTNPIGKEIELEPEASSTSSDIVDIKALWACSVLENLRI